MRLRVALRIACLLPGLAVAAPAPGAGSDEVRGETSPFRLVLSTDVPVIGLAAVASGMPLAFDRELARPDAGVRDRGAIGAFDRIATRQWSTRAGLASDVLLGTSLALPFAWSGIEALAGHAGPRDFAVESVVMAESILVAQGLTQLVKYGVRRDRPLAYNPAAPDADRRSADARLSFPSGHTSLTAAALTSLAYVQWQRHPREPASVVAVVVAAAVTPTVACLRVAAGRHFPTDVIAGGALGTAVGLLVPWLHLRGRDGKAAWLPVPAALPDGAALSFTAAL